MAAEGRLFDFSAASSMLPLEVLEDIQKDMPKHEKSGMAIATEAERNLRDVWNVPDNFKVCFTQGGAAHLFSCIPFNTLGGTKTRSDYLVTGPRSERAYQECAKYGTSQLACNTKAAEFTTIPAKTEWELDADAAYMHYCAHEFANGVEFHYTPDVSDVPLVADMSASFLSKTVEVNKHSCIYAELQTNLGSAGAAVTILSPEFASGKNEMKTCPTHCSWKACVDKGTMHDTPISKALYVMGEYLKYTKKVGGVAHWEEKSAKKSGLIYKLIDESDGFYFAPVEKQSRSRTSVPFTIMGDDPVLTKKFVQGAKKMKLYTLAVHRSAKGCRASLFNGIPYEGAEALHDYMKAFMDENRI